MTKPRLDDSGFAQSGAGHGSTLRSTVPGNGIPVELLIVFVLRCHYSVEMNIGNNCRKRVVGVAKKTNVFSQAFGVLQACRALALVYFVIICVMDVLSEHYDGDLIWGIPYALVVGFFLFYLCANFLELKPKQKVFGRPQRQFVLRYVFLIFLPSLLGGWGVVLALNLIPEEVLSPNMVFIALFLGLGFTIVLPMFIFGTALPAQIVGNQSQILAAVHRAGRQVRYFLPRIIFLFGPFIFVEFVFSLIFQFSALEMMPVSDTGEVNMIGGIMLLLSNLIGVYGDAVLSVLVCRAYLKDLREQGELPLAEAEVFA
ncbi:hypothetical protein ABLO27_21220 [Roseibium sp. SCPC15]|uniref:hypothetical protein n=1 Tax=Roseibium sp. SCP15 TaxID=3141376 RepID=UPI0033372F06